MKNDVKITKTGFNTIELELDSINIEENKNEIFKVPELKNLDEKESSWNIFKNRGLNDMNQPFYNKFEYEKKQKENNDTNNTKTLKWEPFNYDLLLK